MFWVKTGETALDQARENDNPEVALLLTKAPQVRKHTHTEEQLIWQEKAVDFFFFSYIFIICSTAKKQQHSNSIFIEFQVGCFRNEYIMNCSCSVVGCTCAHPA